MMLLRGLLNYDAEREIWRPSPDGATNYCVKVDDLKKFTVDMYEMHKRYCFYLFIDVLRYLFYSQRNMFRGNVTALCLFKKNNCPTKPPYIVHINLVIHHNQYNIFTNPSQIPNNIRPPMACESTTHATTHHDHTVQSVSTSIDTYGGHIC
jgi:hypothetical protein